VLDKLVKDKTVTWRSWADGADSPISARWEVEGFPTMVLIDHAGRIRWRSSGVPSEEELTERIVQLMAEAERPQ
jgi:protein-disulfide isomerase-like protein with CxxC motif